MKNEFKKLLYYDGWGKYDNFYLNKVFTVRNDLDIKEALESIYHETGDTFVWQNLEQVDTLDVLKYENDTKEILHVSFDFLDYDYPSYCGFEIISHQEYLKRLNDEKKSLENKINAEAKLFYESL